VVGLEPHPNYKEPMLIVRWQNGTVSREFCSQLYDYDSILVDLEVPSEKQPSAGLEPKVSRLRLQAFWPSSQRSASIAARAPRRAVHRLAVAGSHPRRRK